MKMAKFGLVVQVIYFCIIASEVRAVSVAEVLFTDLSERLDNLDRTFETRFDAINDRLDRLEEVVRVNEHHSENDNVAENVGKGISENTEIRIAKHKFMKAMVTEKHNLRRFVSDYEHKFDEFKQNVKDILSEVNDTITESNENLVSNMVQHANSVKEQFSDISFKIDTVDNNATLERGGIVSKLQIMEDRIMTIGNNQTFHEDNIQTMESSITSLNSQHVSEISALGNRVSSVNSQRVSDIRSLSRRVSNLDKRKYGFSVYLSATKQYGKGSTIVFDRHTYNYGGHYSTSTGMFTAPKSGTYLFSISVEGTRSKSASAVFMEKGLLRLSAYSAKDGDGTSSNTIVTYLNEGKQGWVESDSDSEFYKYRTTFSGVLLD